jgi:hypothetical protein
LKNKVFSLLLPVLLLLLMAAAVSCLTEGKPVTEPDNEVLIHEPSGLVIPLTTGNWTHTKVNKFSPDGMDMGYTYHHTSGDPAWATLYIYPAGHSLSRETVEAHFAECREAIFKLYPNGVLLMNTEEMSSTGEDILEGASVVRYESGGQGFITWLFLRYEKGWYLKYRITMEEEFNDMYADDVEYMMTTKKTPIIPLGSF